MAGIAYLLASGIQGALEQNALRQQAESAADQVAMILDPYLTASDMSGQLSPARYAQTDALVHQEILHQHIVRVKIWNATGMLIYSDQQDLVGLHFPPSDELKAALAGTFGTDVSTLSKAENQAERPEFDRLLDVYVPLRPMGSSQVLGAYEIYHDLSALDPHIADMRRFVWLSVGIGFLVLYVSLFTLVHRASRELVRRNAENARLYGETRQLYGETRQLYHGLSKAYDHTLEALAAALDARDKETEGHSRRVVAYALALARQLNMPEDELTTLQRGALLHDIGKIGVPDAILRKPGPLSAEEWQVMRRHPDWGRNILAGIPFLAGASRIVSTHQERWDGSGYPAGLAGEAIPLGARIFAVADTYDAITSARSYRAARSYSIARAEIERVAGTQFDPKVAEAFRQIPESEWTSLRAAATAVPSLSSLALLWPQPEPAPVAVGPRLRAEGIPPFGPSGKAGLTDDPKGLSGRDGAAVARAT
jgi:HD-GYP domain-containing protein (c-di-GMP phosphodiesterase class II)